MNLRTSIERLLSGAKEATGLDFDVAELRVRIDDVITPDNSGVVGAVDVLLRPRCSQANRNADRPLTLVDATNNRHHS